MMLTYLTPYPPGLGVLVFREPLPTMVGSASLRSAFLFLFALRCPSCHLLASGELQSPLASGDGQLSW